VQENALNRSISSRADYHILFAYRELRIPSYKPGIGDRRASVIDFESTELIQSRAMRGKHIGCNLIACLCLALAAVNVQAEPLRNGSADSARVMAIDPSEPAALDPTVVSYGPSVSAPAAVPEPSTVRMMLLGFSGLVGLTVMRRRHRRP
jgi:PEP-CTERM motif-containing protein